MNKLTKLLPVLGIVLGATMAMAMNFANPIPNEQYARDPDDQMEFIDVTHLTLGVDYTCSDSGDCLYDAPNGTVIESGTFAWKP